MPPIKVVRSVTFGLVIWYGVLFGGSSLLFVALLFWQTIGFVDRQVSSILRAELGSLDPGPNNFDPDRLANHIRFRARLSDGQGLYFGLIDRDGVSLAGNLPDLPNLPEQIGGVFDHVLPPGRSDAGRTIRGLVHPLPDGARLLVGLDVEDETRLQRLIGEGLITGMVLMLALSFAGAVILRRVVGTRLQRVNRTCEDIMDGDLDRRVPRSGADDEFDHLADNINRMLDEIQYLMESKRNMSTTIAHDLRHPLTRLKGLVETALTAPTGEPTGTDVGAVRTTLERIQAELDDVIGLFNALLRISKVEAGSGRENFDLFAIDETIRDACDLYAPLAEEKGVGFLVSLPNETRVFGDNHLVAQAVANILDNAVKYTPCGGGIGVSLAASAEWVEFSVSDNGPGVPAALHPMLSRRFYRVDQSRSTQGHGLGLTLVAAVAKLHGGHLWFEDNHPGLRVRLQLPRHAPER